MFNLKKKSKNTKHLNVLLENCTILLIADQEIADASSDSGKYKMISLLSYEDYLTSSWFKNNESMTYGTWLYNNM